ncbi:hypothetical protein QTP70_028074, partial [Hemibagrus guttatus]
MHMESTDSLSVDMVVHVVSVQREFQLISEDYKVVKIIKQNEDMFSTSPAESALAFHVSIIQPQLQYFEAHPSAFITYNKQTFSLYEPSSGHPVEIFSSVGDSSVQEVVSAVGQSVTFPFSVPVSGTISYKGDTVGQVLNKQSEITGEKFLNRLHWVSQSGSFTLSDLRTDDSGLYTVQSTKEPKGKQEYQLEVYERVSAPQVMNTSSRSSEFCSLLCSVRNGRGLKLSAYEDEVLLNQTSSSSTSDITLNLHLEIKKTDNHTFSCVASNPVSSKTTNFSFTDVCSQKRGSHPDERTSRTIVIAVVVSLISVMAVIMMLVYLKKRKQNEASRRTEG